MNQNLVPCPFCRSATAPRLGDNVELGIHVNTEFYGHTVYCSGAPRNGGCGANCGFYETEAEAVEHWNRRGAVSLPASGATREEFEAWAEDKWFRVGADTTYHPTANEYNDREYQAAWEGYSAAAARIELLLSSVSAASLIKKWEDRWEALDPTDPVEGSKTIEDCYEAEIADLRKTLTIAELRLALMATPPSIESSELTYAIAGKLAEFYPQETPRDMEKNHRLARAVQRMPMLRAALATANQSLSSPAPASETALREQATITEVDR